jgi:deoxycytidine triphosphate deaminase/addiction module HigA family antidote
MLDPVRDRPPEGSQPGGELSPGGHLRAEIERLGLDQVAVADAAGVSRQTINNIVNGRQPISRAMAAKLGRLTNRSSDYWMRSSFPGGGGRENSPINQPQTAPASDETAKIRARGVAVLVNHQITRAVKDGIIGIEPFDAGNVQMASLDLTLDDFIITSIGERIDISDGQTFTLKAGRTVNVCTKEWIELPLDYIARVGAMTKLAKYGIMTSHGFQVDPGFKGSLQFCLFNAGGNGFDLRSGIPIISLEIMPLSATPSSDQRASDHVRAASNRDTVISHFRNDICNRLIRDAIRSRVKIDDVPDGFSAEIVELGVELIEITAEAALDSAVKVALSALHSLCVNSRAAAKVSKKYTAFFGEIAERLYLSADQVRSAIACVGLPAENDDNPVVKLHNGEIAVIYLPPKSAKITLKHLAGQLGETPENLILLLCGLRGAGAPDQI